MKHCAVRSIGDNINISIGDNITNPDDRERRHKPLPHHLAHQGGLHLVLAVVEEL